MKLKVSKSELQEKLSDIQNIVEKKNTMPVLSHFLLVSEKKGSYIIATDLETAIREPIEVAIEEEGRLSIPARKLFEIVREVEGDITLSTDDSQWLKVKSGASTFRLACLSADEFPVWPEMEEAEGVEIPSATLNEMIEKTVYSAGESDTRYTLNGLLFHIKAKEGALTVVGTDGHRMAVINRTISAALKEEKKVIVPRKAASELRKFLNSEGNVSALIGKNHVLFKTGDVSFLARLIEGTYPNYSQVLPEKNEKKVLVQRDALTRALRRVSIMSRERSNAVRMDFKKGSIALSSSNPDLGEAKDEVSIVYSGDELSIGYNAKYLLDALGAMSKDNVYFELQDPLSPTLLREEDDENYKCVIMPMRI
jgi:DNA polymerase-3 subunit beta